MCIIHVRVVRRGIFYVACFTTRHRCCRHVCVLVDRPSTRKQISEWRKTQNSVRTKLVQNNDFKKIVSERDGFSDEQKKKKKNSPKTDAE